MARVTVPTAPEHRPQPKFKPPTQKAVSALERQTGKSTRQCYYWLLEKLRQEAACP